MKYFLRILQGGINHIDTAFFGAGFQLETNPLSAKKVFSYRLQVGLEAREIEDDDNMTLELGGLGVAGGANFGVGSGKTILTTTIGVRVFGFAGESEWYDEKEDLDGGTTELFFSVGILF